MTGGLQQRRAGRAVLHGRDPLRREISRSWMFVVGRGLASLLASSKEQYNRCCAELCRRCRGERVRTAAHPCYRWTTSHTRESPNADTHIYSRIRCVSRSCMQDRITPNMFVCVLAGRVWWLSANTKNVPVRIAVRYMEVRYRVRSQLTM